MTDRASGHKPDPVHDGLAAAGIERALAIYGQMRNCDEAQAGEARKIITALIETLVDAGEQDEQRLVVRALAHLKARDRECAADRARHVPLL